MSYRVTAGASQSKTYAIHTTPAAGDMIRIGVYGDVRGGHEVHRRMVNAMKHLCVFCSYIMFGLALMYLHKILNYLQKELLHNINYYRLLAN